MHLASRLYNFEIVYKVEYKQAWCLPQSGALEKPRKQQALTDEVAGPGIAVHEMHVWLPIMLEEWQQRM